MESKLKELKDLMCISADASEADITNYFEKIAGILQEECVILYDQKEYRILDFEFYFYNKKHQDISVHPRNTDALCWYINDFGGIDLTFESRIEKCLVLNNNKLSFKYKMTNGSYYGGILIRQIQELGEEKRVYDSPLKVAELFRVFDAT